MKNFMQFAVPMIIIIAVAVFFLLPKNEVGEKKLYVKCGNNSESYSLYSNKKIEFSKEEEECYLDITITNVQDDYIKINTKYLKTDDDSVEPKVGNIIPYNEKVVLYTNDNDVMITFEYR